MAAIGFGLPKDAFTSLMKQVTNDCQLKLTFMSLWLSATSGGQRYWNQIMESWLLVAYSDSSWLHPSVSIPSSISITFLIFSHCDHLCPQICVAFCWMPFVLLHNATIILSYYTSQFCLFFLQRWIWGGHILQPLYSLIKYIGLWSDIEHVFCLDAAFSTITNFWIEYLESLPFHLPISWLSSCDMC